MHPRAVDGELKMSRYKEDKPVLLRHKHCPICGMPVEPSKIFCSSKCEQENESVRKKKRNWTIIMFVPLIAFMLLMILGPRL